MTDHQIIALALWGTAGATVVFLVLQALGQLFGFKNIVGMILAALIMRVAPFALVGYTIWAFWPK